MRVDPLGKRIEAAARRLPRRGPDRASAVGAGGASRRAAMCRAPPARDGIARPRGRARRGCAASSRTPGGATRCQRASNASRVRSRPVRWQFEAQDGRPCGNAERPMPRRAEPEQGAAQPCRRGRARQFSPAAVDRQAPELRRSAPLAIDMRASSAAVAGRRAGRARRSRAPAGANCATRASAKSRRASRILLAAAAARRPGRRASCARSARDALGPAADRRRSSLACRHHEAGDPGKGRRPSPRRRR